MQTRLSSNMQEPALLWHKSASELRQRERSSFDSKWVRDSCQRHRGRLCYPTENCRLIRSDQYGLSHIERNRGYNSAMYTKETLMDGVGENSRERRIKRAEGKSLILSFALEIMT